MTPIENMITPLTPKIDAISIIPNIASTPVAAAIRNPIIISTTERVTRKTSITQLAKVSYTPIIPSQSWIHMSIGIVASLVCLVIEKESEETEG